MASHKVIVGNVSMSGCFFSCYQHDECGHMTYKTEERRKKKGKAIPTKKSLGEGDFLPGVERLKYARGRSTGVLL